EGGRKDGTKDAGSCSAALDHQVRDRQSPRRPGASPTGVSVLVDCPQGPRAWTAARPESKLSAPRESHRRRETMRTAIYARVSTDRQERTQTIDSQLTALHAWVTAQGHELRPEHIYRDEGASGAHLDRPGLDRLRDAARNGDFELVGVLSPDRLAR